MSPKKKRSVYIEKKSEGRKYVINSKQPFTGCPSLLHLLYQLKINKKNVQKIERLDD